MALGFPLYINLYGNNCVVLGGGEFAYQRTKTLLDLDVYKRQQGISVKTQRHGIRHSRF